ncbi:endophilin-B1 isoform X2 [Parasteatoda tepidariorum]|uniref:endophilin-B1 isoform X2 n=1 Tax=Parasteatoda tepidariorum TaxID=114398 RepID=UPI00077FA9DB|nr:endophilin-B1 isoform X2 [Parasteatoda tepidariorum]
MDFSMKSIKGFAADAATAFSRAVQYTEEKLGTSEKTELDAHYDGLALRADRTKHWTERLVSRTDAVLQPNPNTRVEDYFFEKLDKRREHPSNLDLLGQDMIDAGADLGSGTPYGTALIKIGQAQQRLGAAEREFVRASMTTFVSPLKRFLEGDMKTIVKERKILENKRLDLDACKSRLRKARSMESQANAETELRISQAEFDRQAEITRLLLEGISSAHANHLRCLSDFVEAQAAFYNQCQQFMVDLQKELTSTSTASKPKSGGYQGLYPSSPSPSDMPLNSLPDDKKRARVLYNYEAYDTTELSLTADEVIVVSNLAVPDTDWMMGERGTEKGKVPVAYLEILN